MYTGISLGTLLLVDPNDTINRTLFEIYSIQYSVGNTFHLKFVHNDHAFEYTFYDALPSVGYSGTTTLSTLESRYFKLYTQYQHNHYLSTNDLVKATSVFAQQPSELKTSIGGSGITLSNDLYIFTINYDFMRTEYTNTNDLTTLISRYATLSYVNTELTSYTNTTNLTTLLLGKNESLHVPAGDGSPLIDAPYNNVRRIDTNSPLSYTVQNGVTITLSCDSYTTSHVDT